MAEHLEKGVAVTNVNAQKPVKRRTTFSIAPEHMKLAQQSFRPPVTVVTDKKSFLGDIQADSYVRRDSAIDLDDDDEVLTPPPVKADTDYTPHEINAKDYMDKVLRGKIKFSPVKKREPLHMQDVRRRVAEKAAKMPDDGVLVVKTNTDQVASLVLPQELKTVADRDNDQAQVPRIEITRDEDVVVCIIGVGYVGKELLEGFGRVFTSIGFDVSQNRLDFIAPEFADFEKVTLTSDVAQLAKGTHYLIAVPTNLHKDHSVNATHLLSAISMVATYARPGATVVIESSVSVGMTRAFLSQYAGTLKCGMSPERVDPGRASPTLIEIPKVISGLDQESLVAIHDVYSKVFQKVVPVSKPEVAEMTKLYENCYRMVNIAYVNEIADACKKHGIEANEVIDAAATKPFGFQPFRPGLGVGGHCIPVNPYYLFVNNELPVLEFASTRMWARPARLAQDLYNDTLAARKAFSSEKADDGPLRVLVIGVGFKPGQNVISCSPGLAYAQAMNDIGSKDLSFYDPLVPQSDVPWMRRLKQQEFTSEQLSRSFDIIAVCMKQTGVDWTQLERLEGCVVKYY